MTPFTEKFQFAHPLGSDVRTINGDIDDSLSLCSGLECLAQDLQRRLMTLSFYLDDYGIPLTDWVNAPLGSTAGKLPQLVENELLKDERVTAVTCISSLDAVQKMLSLNISVVAKTGQSFSFVGNIAARGFVPPF